MRPREPPQRPEIHYWNEAVAHVAFWYDAIVLQRDRLGAEMDTTDERSLSRVIDATLLLVSLHRLERACAFAAKQLPQEKSDEVHAARSKWLNGYPDVARLRHRTEHFDAWLVGEGHGQITPRDGYPFQGQASYRVIRGQLVEYRFTVDDASVDLLAAADAALEMGRVVNSIFNRDVDDLIARTHRQSPAV